MRPARWIVAAAVVAGTCVTARRATAETRTYVIAIGNNAPPEGRGGAGDGALLHYADDDAAAVAAFGLERGAHTELLAVLDGESQRRFPALAAVALPPTLAQLRRVVANYRQRFEADARQGHDPVLMLFYSGHGVIAPDSPPALTMLDGPLTRAVLYDEILAVLPARYIHLVIDACHAEAVIRPRDVQADVAPARDADLESYAAKNTLRRFPNVGAVVATASAAEAHEWDQYQRGIFSYQILSGLRGAADINRDGLIEYSELYAFIGSANAQVLDPRARLAVIVRPPAVNPRAPLADVTALARRGATLSGVGPGVGRFHVEDERGNRVAEMLAEAGYHFRLFVPAGVPLCFRTEEGEEWFRLEPGQQREVDSFRPRERTAQARGAMETSLRNGLFATPFGPTYYRGFVDARPDLFAVAAATSEPAAAVVRIATPTRDERAPSTVPALVWIGGGVAAVGIAAGVGFGLRVLSLNDEIDRTCVATVPCSADDRQRYEQAVSDAKTARVLSIAGFGLAGAALIGSGALWWHTAHGAKDSALAMTPIIGADTVGATLGGRW
ncbi:MAG TPA: caspase family protein [Polyangia bacterium]|nr:caspase family protein [Polyangia bacterium]